jgi:hypothetical protein
MVIYKEVAPTALLKSEMRPPRPNSSNINPLQTGLEMFKLLSKMKSGC